MNTQKISGFLGAATLLLAITILSGCSNTAMFASIEQEVKINDPTMRGIITSMVELNGNLYIANGSLYQRTGGSGAWNKMDLPSGASRCSEVASDGTYLYARFSAEDMSVFHSVKRYDHNTGYWANVDGVDNIALIGSGKGRIYAFTGSSDSYVAYVTPSAGSTAFTATAIASGIKTPTGTAGDYISTSKKVYRYDGTTLAEAGGAGTSPAGVTGITSRGTDLYAVKSGNVYHFSEATNAWASIAHSLSSPTTNIAYLEAGGKKELLIASGSTSGGISEITLNADGTLKAPITTPGDSDQSAVATGAQSQYLNSVDLWAVHRVFAVSTAVPAGDAYVLYASVIHYTYDGLWSYYSSSRNEWNRE